MFLFLPYWLDQYMCPETYSVSPDLSAPLIFFVLRTYTCVVYPFSLERQRLCPPEVHPLNSMRGGRKVDVMSTQVKEDQEVVHLEDNPRG
jgi:hypothetical protein